MDFSPADPKELGKKGRVRISQRLWLQAGCGCTPLPTPWQPSGCCWKARAASFGLPRPSSLWGFASFPALIRRLSLAGLSTRPGLRAEGGSDPGRSTSVICHASYSPDLAAHLATVQSGSVRLQVQGEAECEGGGLKGTRGACGLSPVGKSALPASAHLPAGLSQQQENPEPGWRIRPGQTLCGMQEPEWLFPTPV